MTNYEKQMIKLNKAALKVKSKSLAAEARIIRKEEGKAFKNGDFTVGSELYEHRRAVVRVHARATHLVRAYLFTGLEFISVDNPNAVGSAEFEAEVLPKVKAMLQKYGSADKNFEDFKYWMYNDVK